MKPKQMTKEYYNLSEEHPEYPYYVSWTEYYDDSGFRIYTGVGSKKQAEKLKEVITDLEHIKNPRIAENEPKGKPTFSTRLSYEFDELNSNNLDELVKAIT